MSSLVHIQRRIAVLGIFLALDALFRRTRSLAAFSAATLSPAAFSKRSCLNRAVLAATTAGAARYSCHAFAPYLAHSFRLISKAAVGFKEIASNNEIVFERIW